MSQSLNSVASGGVDLGLAKGKIQHKSVNFAKGDASGPIKMQIGKKLVKSSSENMARRALGELSTNAVLKPSANTNNYSALQPIKPSDINKVVDNVKPFKVYESTTAAQFTKDKVKEEQTDNTKEQELHHQLENVPKDVEISSSAASELNVEVESKTAVDDDQSDWPEPENMYPMLSDDAYDALYCFEPPGLEEKMIPDPQDYEFTMEPYNYNILDFDTDQLEMFSEPGALLFEPEEVIESEKISED